MILVQLEGIWGLNFLKCWELWPVVTWLMISYDATIMNYLHLLGVYSMPISLPASVRNLKSLEGPMLAPNVLSKSSYEKKKSITVIENSHCLILPVSFRAGTYQLGE